MRPTRLLAAGTAALLALQCHALTGAVRPQEPNRRAENAISASRILASPHYRAIFCGRDGTEAGAAYARALASDLRRLEAAGQTTSDALEHLKRRACPAE